MTSEGYSELDLQYKKADTNNGHVPYKEGEDTNFLLSELGNSFFVKLPVIRFLQLFPFTTSFVLSLALFVVGRANCSKNGLKSKIVSVWN